MTEALIQVAIIDDDDALLRALGRLIRSLGYEPSPFADGATFLAQARLDRIGCVVTDVQMPGLTGLDVLTQTKARAPNLPVIVTTAYPSQARREDMIARGAFAYLAKPISASTLEAVIDEALAAR